MAVVELLPAVQAELAASLVNSLFRTMPFRLSRPGREDEQIIFAGVGTLTYLRHRPGKVALQPLHVVVDAQTALLSEGLEIVALLSAGHTGSGNVYGHERHPGISQVGYQVLDRVHRRNSPVGFVNPV